MAVDALVQCMTSLTHILNLTHAALYYLDQIGWFTVTRKVDLECLVGTVTGEFICLDKNGTRLVNSFSSNVGFPVFQAVCVVNPHLLIDLLDSWWTISDFLWTWMGFSEFTGLLHNVMGLFQCVFYSSYEWVVSNNYTCDPSHLMECFAVVADGIPV